MQDTEIYTKLTPIFHDIFDDESIVLTPTLTADEVPDWDSFRNVALLVRVEAAFGVKFRAAEVEAMRDLGALVGCIQGKLAQQGK
jgi:acyl carrier protein